jgi:hypothetical protein
VANSVIKKSETPITRFVLFDNGTKTIHFTNAGLISSDRGDLIVGGVNMNSRGATVINHGVLSIVVKSASDVDIINNESHTTNIMVVGGYPV